MTFPSFNTFAVVDVIILCVFKEETENKSINEQEFTTQFDTKKGEKKYFLASDFQQAELVAWQPSDDSNIAVPRKCHTQRDTNMEHHCATWILLIQPSSKICFYSICSNSMFTAEALFLAYIGLGRLHGDVAEAG